MFCVFLYAQEILKVIVGIESRSFWMRAYRYHLLSQHRDRQCYYFERAHSVSTSLGDRIGFETSLCIICDAMGQCAFKVPRHLPGSKILANCARPQLHMVGVIAHGFHKAGFLFDATIGKDSNLWCEIMSVTLMRVWSTCRERNLQPPARIVIMGDNAGDNKNTYTFEFTALLVFVRMLRVAMNGFLRTGHSHEDIDAVFGNWGKCLYNQPTLQDPTDFRDVLAKQFPDTTFSIIHFVHDWQDLLTEITFDM